MFTVTALELLAPEGAPPISPDQVWSALEHHVRTGDTRFVPPEHFFELVETHAHGVVRRGLLGQGDQAIAFVQRVDFHARRVMAMSTIEGPFSVRIISIEADLQGRYGLRLTVSAGQEGPAHGGPDERAMAERVGQATRASVERWLSVTRQLVEAGELHAS